MPPGRVTACRPTVMPRQVILTAQAVEDTAVIAASYPLKSGRVLLTEPVGYFRAAYAGLTEKRVLVPLMGPPPPICDDRPILNRDELEDDARRVSGVPLAPADIRLYIDGCEALAALDAVIDSATCRLDVYMYLWGSDRIGWHVARKLAAKAGPNLPVRILMDGGGQLMHGEPRNARADEVNRAVCWLAHQPCVQVIRERNGGFRFDHRKLVIADGREAWDGGRNFVDSAFEKDHDVSYTLTGRLAAEWAHRFDENWEFQGGEMHCAPAPTPVDASTPNAMARLVRTRPVDHSLARLLYDAVAHARHHVYVENPYFGDNHLVYLLAQARQRGADVRVVLTTQSDSPIYDRSNKVMANRLLAAGCRVYMYPGMMHVKALAVDGVWAYTGTGNFDNLSLRHNREAGVAVSDGPFLQEFEKRLFHADFNPEWELTKPLPVGPFDYLYELIATSTA
jgi:phosphatidylserine/phosphatidylglycerophosphate/cardiolipin synthase-like enzyme